MTQQIMSSQSPILTNGIAIGAVEITKPTKCINLYLQDEKIKELQEILSRALNCAPEFGKHWFDLADVLDELTKSGFPKPL
jgi:hypothetical protein